MWYSSRMLRRRHRLVMLDEQGRSARKDPILPVKLQSSTASMLLLSWVENPSAVSSRHTMSLYHTELGSYDALTTDSTTNNHYSFTALDSCSRYVACLEIADTHSLTCLSAFTHPDIPKDFKMTSWNTSSMSLAWDCLENCKFSVFLLTTFYLNETDHVIKAAPLLNEEDNFVFILSDLQPCSRVKFGLQTVCQVGMESRYSKMLLHDGNSGKMTSQTAQVLLSLDAEAVVTLKEGVNFKKNPEDGKCYIIYKSSDELKACKNQCKHQGGLFIQDIEDLDGRTVKCTKHNWRLNVSTMKYVNPPDSFLQDELEVEILDDGGLQLVELSPIHPWLADPREPLELQEGEVKVTYMTHACVELQLGQCRFMFDPWLKGPAFARGWWLSHEPPADCMDRLCAADLIYISHMHSDHLSYPTLKVLSERRPDVPIYVGDTSRPVFWFLEGSQVKLTNIKVIPFGVWQNIDEHLRFMILMDGVHPEMDTCIIVEYKGHLILNTVDCTRPNGGRLPQNVDLMMSDFAGGASGFPMSFCGGKYSDSWKSDFIKTERKKLLNYKAQLVKSLQPRIYCPFAGYFVEAHPSDRYIKDTNVKNSAKDLNGLINKLAPEIMTWTPKPGAVLDLGLALRDPTNSEAITNPPASAKIYKDSWDFDLYVDELNSAISCEIFKHQSWIQFYYTWAGFQNYNLVVRVIETDDNFEPHSDGYDYLVDFLDLSFPTERPDREHAYIEIKNRIGVMRSVVLCGRLWDELYYGFQNRISRDPDIFHYRFWNHFQIELPVHRPDWDRFLQQEASTGSQEPDKLQEEGRMWSYCVVL